MNDRIMIFHPVPGKQGVCIERAKYELAAQAIQEAIRQQGEITFEGLTQALGEALQGGMEGRFRGM